MSEVNLDIHEEPLSKQEAHERRLYLGVMQEECAEVIQAISKINRFGIDSYHPAHPSTTNRDNLISELGDMMAMVQLLMKVPSLRLTPEEIEVAMHKKFDKMKFWAARGY